MKTIKINNLEVSVDELRRVIKENPEILQEEKKPFAERMIGKEYWVINANGDKIKYTWQNVDYDKDCLSLNNTFFTESDCDKEIARRKALGNIMSYIRDNDIELIKDEDWKNKDIVKYGFGGWDYRNNELIRTSNFTYDDSVLRENFYSQEDREKVISNCANDLEILLKK